MTESTSSGVEFKNIINNLSSLSKKSLKLYKDMYEEEDITQ